MQYAMWYTQGVSDRPDKEKKKLCKLNVPMTKNVNLIKN